MKITCLGYKKSFVGDKLWYYKLVLETLEFLIVDANMIKLLDVIWTNKNTFENANLSDEMLTKVKSKIKKLSKKQFELGEDVEKTFFTQHEIKEETPVKKPKRKKGVFTSDEVNSILQILNEFDCIDRDVKYTVIDKEMCDYAIEEESEFFTELLGYKVMVKVDGDHRNDGQMVDYTFTFVSPSKKKTTFSTEMCLMVGWNYHDKLKIN